MPKLPPGETTKILGKRVKERREALHIEQKQLADMLGFAHSSISRCEDGTQAPGAEAILKIANALDCTIDYLFGRVNRPHYLLINGEQVPKDLQNESVDAVEVLRTQVQADGGLTADAHREVLRIVANAEILRHSTPRQSKPEQPDANETPPD